MFSQNQIILMVGLPACGKTTLSYVIQQQAQILNQNCHLIELDQILNENQQMDVQGKWQRLRNSAYSKARQFVKSNGLCTVIIDDTNEYRSMRKPYWRLAQEFGMKYLEIHFQNFTVYSSLVRDSQRQAQVGDQVINNIANRIEWNDVVGGQDWKIEFESVEEVFVGIQNSKVPQNVVIWEPTIDVQPDSHILDLQLRKKLQELVQEFPQLKSKGQDLNDIRKQILKHGQSVQFFEMQIREFI